MNLFFQNILNVITKKHSTQILKSEFADKVAKLQSIIGYKFNNPDFLVFSLTHDSYTYDTLHQKSDSKSETNLLYERLEFLGDAVLGIIVAEYLFQKHKKEDEGFLSKLKSNIVSEKYLAMKGNYMQIGSFIIMSEKEERNGGRERKSIIADTMEAVIAAIYLDGGLEKAREFITTYIINDYENQIQLNELINYKSILQEYCQPLYQNTPEYKLITEKGPDHSKTFEMEVYINDTLCGLGVGTTKKEAQQQAAHNACIKLKLI